MSTIAQPRYYVYILCRPDGRPFYVGKGGKRNRPAEHFAEARSTHNCHKCNVIRQIWNSGEQVFSTIVYHTDDEQDAYQYEKALIAAIGRDHLTNITDGGEGKSSPGESNPAAKLTEKQISEIRQRWVTEATRLVDLAAEYGVTYRTLVSVVRQEHWGVDDNIPRTRSTEQRGALRRGERGARARFTMDEVRIIRTRYAAGEASASQIAAEYGVYQTCISKIVCNATYHDPSYDPSTVKRNKVVPDRSGENGTNVKLTWDIVRAIRARYAAGASSDDLAAEYGIASGTVRGIFSNRTWVDPNYVPPSEHERAERRYQKLRKLSLDIAREIRTRYAAGGIGYGKLAAEYGVSMAAIVKVVKGETFREP